MKNLKKVLALVMAFAMAFTMMAGAAYTDQDDIQATDAVELLNTLNVMTGKGDGMFHPNDTITRAEICRIIYTIRNEGNDNANAYADMQTSFQDLTSADDWAKGYIKHCQSVNLISGRDEAGTIFGPQDPVTGVELAVICLRVLGYDPAKAGIGGESWSTKTIGLASEAGLLKGVNMESVTGPCERQWAAQIMANMLDARTVRWSTDGDRYTTYAEDGTENRKVGREYMKLHSSIGTLINIDGGNLEITQNSSDRADSDGAMLTSFTNVNTDYTELLGQKVNVLYSDGKANSVIGVYALSGNTVYTVNANAVESDGQKVKFDGKSYSIESITSNSSSSVGSINTYYTAIDGGHFRNYSITGSGDIGREFTTQSGVTHRGVNSTYEETISGTKYTYSLNVFEAEDLFDDWNTSSAVMKFVDSDENGRLDSVIITDYAAAEVTSATSTRVIAGKTYEYADHNIDEGISQGDWVSISYNRFDDCSDVKKLETTTGNLDGFKRNSTSEGNSHAVVLTDSDDKVTESGKDKLQFNEYRVDNAWFNHATDKDSHTDISTVRAGDSIEYILLNGTAWLMKRASAGALDDVVDVAMVVNKNNSVGGQQVKLQFFNDTTAVVDVDTYSTEGERVSWNDLKTGTLYEYSVSGGKYIFENLKNVNADAKYKDFYGDYTYEGSASYTIGSSSNDKIGTKTIDDKAKVILFEGDVDTKLTSDNKSDVITGRQLKNLKNVLAKVNTHYFTADMSGLNRAAALALVVDEIPGTLTSNDYYGYILSDARFSQGNSELEYNLLLETGETITAYERSTRIDDRKANTLIGYKSLSAEDSNGKRYVDDVTLYNLSSNNFGVGAITSVNDSQTTVEIAAYGKEYEVTTNALRPIPRDIATDTVKFFVNTDEKTGETTGTIRTAMDFTNATDMPDAETIMDGAKEKVINCLYLDRDGDDLEVIVVESGDRIFRGPYMDAYHNRNADAGKESIEAGSTLNPDGTPANSNTIPAPSTNTTATFRISLTNILANDVISMTSTDSAITMSNHTVTAAEVTAGYVNLAVNVTAGQPVGTYPLTFTVTRTASGSSTDVASAKANLTINAVDATMPTSFTGTTTRLQAGMTVSDANIGNAALTGESHIAWATTNPKTAVLRGTANQGATLKVGDIVDITFTMTLADNYKVPANWKVPALWDAAKESADAPVVNGQDVTVTIAYTVPDTDANLIGAVARNSTKITNNDDLTAALPAADWGTLANQITSLASSVTVPNATLDNTDGKYQINLGGTYTKAANTSTLWEGFGGVYNTQDYVIIPLSFKAPEGAKAAQISFTNAGGGVDTVDQKGNISIMMAIPTAATAPGEITIQWLRSENVADTMGTAVVYKFTKTGLTIS